VIGIPSIRIASNIIAHQQSRTNSGAAGIQLETGVKKALVTSNIVFNWSNPILNDGTRDIAIRSNQLQDPAVSTVLIDQRRSPTLGLYQYANNVYGPSSKRMNRIQGQDQSFNDWTDATHESSASLKTIQYVAPTRSIASYNASVGGKHTFMAWINAIRSQSESGWNARYTAAPMLQYIRDGFARRS